MRRRTGGRKVGGHRIMASLGGLNDIMAQPRQGLVAAFQRLDHFPGAGVGLRLPVVAVAIEPDQRRRRHWRDHAERADPFRQHIGGVEQLAIMALGQHVHAEKHRAFHVPMHPMGAGHQIVGAVEQVGELVGDFLGIGHASIGFSRGRFDIETGFHRLLLSSCGAVPVGQ